jgi:CRP-like cAMP-binding protein
MRAAQRWRGAAMGGRTNGLIDRLSLRERTDLLGACEPCILTPSDVLARPRAQLPYVFFPIGGLVSITAGAAAASALEVAMIGREGVVGSHVALGVAESPFLATVGLEVSAWRISPQLLQRRLLASPHLARIMLRYTHVLSTQVATAVACVRFHLIRPRLARALLMIRDRCDEDSFSVTQASLAAMLGVRRVGISAEAGVLQQDGLIRYRRGTLTILEPAALREIACRCYRTDRRVYRDYL